PYLRSTGVALLGYEGGRDVVIEQRGGLALLGVNEFLQPGVGGLEDRQVDLEITADFLDDAGGDQLEPDAIAFIAGRADRCRGKMIEQAPSRMLLVGKERPIEERRLENRHLQAPEQLTQRLRDRRIAEDV